MAAKPLYSRWLLTWYIRQVNRLSRRLGRWSCRLYDHGQILIAEAVAEYKNAQARNAR